MTKISFVLLSYNQEAYIRESITAIFAQDIPIDEIILSDDCSTDNTFEIIRQLADSYSGTGHVVVRQNQLNLGLIQHFNKVVEISTGELIILSAGDDISINSRARELLFEYEKGKPLLIHSDVFTISPEGLPFDSPFGKSVHPTLWDDLPDLHTVAKSMILYIGATAAFSRDLFNFFGPIDLDGAYEDLILGYRARLYGKTKFIRKRLVKYRMGVGISSNHSNLTKVSVAVLRQRIRDTKRVNLESKEYRHVLRQLRSLLYSKVKNLIYIESMHELHQSLIPSELGCFRRLRLLAYRFSKKDFLSTFIWR